MESQTIQGLLWKQKRGMGGSSWKKHWVFADDRNFMQWSGKVRPARTEAPKYLFKVSMLDIRELKEADSRRFSFEVHSLEDGTTMVFAADDAPSFNKWMKILKKKIVKTVTIKEEKEVTIEPEVESVTSRSHSALYATDIMSRTSENTEQQDVDPESLMNAFFDQHPDCRLEDLLALLPQITPQLNARRVISVMQSDLQLQRDEPLTRHEFAQWWETNLPILSSTLSEFHRKPDSKPISRAQSTSVLVGSQDIQILSPTPLAPVDANAVPLESTLLRIPAIRFGADDAPDVLKEVLAFKNNLPYGDWAAVYHNACVALHEVSQHKINFGVNADASAEYKMAVLRLLAVRAKFYEVAAQTSQKIIDELVLPPQLQTIKPQALPEHLRRLLPSPSGAPSSDASDSHGGDIVTYNHGGLQFKIVLPILPEQQPLPSDHLSNQEAHPGYSYPHFHSDHEQHLIFLHDALLKVQANDFKAYNLINSAFHRIHTRLTLRNKYRDDVHEINDEILALMAYLSPRLPMFNLATVIDYQFCRVHVYLPLPAHSQVAAVQSSTDGVLLGYLAEEHVAASQGLRWVQRPLTTALSGFELRGHQLLAPDLPATQGQNLYTKHLRPEFSYVHVSGLSAAELDALFEQHSRAPSTTQDGDLEGPGGARDDGSPPIPSRTDGEGETSASATNRPSTPQNAVEETKSPSSLPLPADVSGPPLEHSDIFHNWLRGCRSLYSHQLPQLAQYLDDNVVQIYDCASISSVLHTHGVNLRHMGALYSLCHNAQVKQLLFLNMCARSVKAYLRHLVQLCTQNAMSKTVVYMQKGKSHDRHFIEHQEHANALRVKTIVSVLNYLLHPPSPSSSSSNAEDGGHATNAVQAFYTCLFDLWYQKFGLHLQPKGVGLYTYLIGPSGQSQDAMTTHENVKILLSFLQAQLQIQLKEHVMGLIHTPATSFASRDAQSSKQLPSIQSLSANEASATETSPPSAMPLLQRPLTVLDLYPTHSVKVQVQTCLPTEFGYLHHQLPTLMALRMHVDVVDVLEGLYIFYHHMLSLDILTASLTPTRGQIVCGLVHALSQCPDAIIPHRWNKIHAIVQAYLTHPYDSLVHVHTSRLLGMCMSIYYENHHVDCALTCFDAMMRLNTASLPSNHVLYAMPMLVLARLYTQSVFDESHSSPHAVAHRGEKGLYPTKLMLELALAVLSQHQTYIHNIHVLQLQLALLNMHNEQYYAAIDLLAPMLRVYENHQAVHAVSSLQEYLLICHSLAMCYYHVHDLVLALHCAEKVSNGYRPSHAVTDKLNHQLVLSTQCLVYDIYIQQADYSHALDVANVLHARLLEDVRLQKYGHRYARILQLMAYNIVYLVICTLSSHSKALLESAANEYNQTTKVQADLLAYQAGQEGEGQHPPADSTEGGSSDGIKQVEGWVASWSLCVRSVAEKVLFSNHVTQYVALLLDALQRRHQQDEPTADRTAPPREAAGLVGIVDSHDLGLQAAVLFHFAQQSESTGLVEKIAAATTPSPAKQFTVLAL